MELSEGDFIINLEKGPNNIYTDVLTGRVSHMFCKDSYYTTFEGLKEVVKVWKQINSFKKEKSKRLEIIFAAYEYKFRIKSFEELENMYKNFEKNTKEKYSKLFSFEAQKAETNTQIDNTEEIKNEFDDIWNEYIAWTEHLQDFCKIHTLTQGKGMSRNIN
jgi:hypothetical protein